MGTQGEKMLVTGSMINFIQAILLTLCIISIVAFAWGAIVFNEGVAEVLEGDDDDGAAGDDDVDEGYTMVLQGIGNFFIAGIFIFGAYRFLTFTILNKKWWKRAV